MPTDHWREIVTLLIFGKRDGRAQSAIRFDTRDEVLCAQMAVRATGQCAERPGDAHAVPELHALVRGEILLEDGVLRDVPCANNTRENQLGFEFMSRSALEVRDGLIRDASAAEDLLLNPTRLVDAFVFNVQDRIHAMF